MYDENMVGSMREELTSAGVQELRTPKEVDDVLGNASGSMLVIVNSVCGCAAGGARPGAVMALKSAKTPTKAVTVFAGQDKEATARAREYFKGHQPSSPCFAILKDGQVVHMIPRHEIEGHSAQEVAAKLTNAFETHC